MEIESLAAALEREHRDIDGGIEAFSSSLATGSSDTGSLGRAMDGLRRHIYLEEQFLFPPLREAGLVGPLFVMVREHGQLWRTMQALEAALAEGTGTDSVAGLCEQLTAQLHAHNSKEEPIVYPQADAVLAPGATAQLRAFLESGRFPDGWVCQAARR